MWDKDRGSSAAAAVPGQPQDAPPATFSLAGREPHRQTASTPHRKAKTIKKGSAESSSPQSRYTPPGTGGVAAPLKKSSEASEAGADGVVGEDEIFSSRNRPPRPLHQ